MHHDFLMKQVLRIHLRMLATPEGDSHLGSNSSNSKASKNSSLWQVYIGVDAFLLREINETMQVEGSGTKTITLAILPWFSHKRVNFNECFIISLFIGFSETQETQYRRRIPETQYIKRLNTNEGFQQPELTIFSGMPAFHFGRSTWQWTRSSSWKSSSTSSWPRTARSRE